jgi:8-oxo-dGTP pyrophosphatase MutT (NUDIX family)
VAFFHSSMAVPRILNPRAAPVVSTDAHLPAIPAEMLQEAPLRLRLAQALGCEPEIEGDGRFNTERTPAAAAVLVPLVQRAKGLQVLLTRRTEQLRDHAGQISFPGGRADPGDHGAVGTALREAHEEVGLGPDHIRVIGQLAPYTTVTQFVVTPVVALVQPPFELKLQSTEVAEAFEVPFEHLMNPANHQRHVLMVEGGERQFLSMPWVQIQPDGSAREYFIWGATAAMLRNFYRVLARSV